MKFMKKLLSCVTSAEYAVMVRCFVAMVASYFHFCAESEFYPGLHALDRRDSHIQYDLYGASWEQRWV